MDEADSKLFELAKRIVELVNSSDVDQDRRASALAMAAHVIDSQGTQLGA